MEILNLQQTSEVILVWINSVETAAQLQLVKEAVNTFIIERFTGRVKDKDLSDEHELLKIAIWEKEKTINQYGF